MRPDIVIHIGFSRTGTTTLQRHLFAKHSQIRYMGKPYTDDVFKREIDHLVKQETMVYDSSALRQYISENFWKQGNKKSKKVILISDEIMVSYSKVRDKGVVARRIKEVFDPRILITIRNQYDILKSAYLSRGRLLMNVPSKYAGLSIRFTDWLELSYQNIDRSYLGHVDYFKTIDYYSQLFGKDNVCVLLFEEFVENTNEYLETLSNFLNIDLNEAVERTENKHEHKEIPQSQLNFERFRTGFYPLSRIPLIFNVIKPFFALMGCFRKDKTAKVTIPGDWQQRLNAMYREGNRKLIEKYTLPLEKYGYPV